jgi:hypothetical protein
VHIEKGSRQILARAAVLIGGAEILASRLAINAGMLRMYLEGNEEIPRSVLLQAIDIILEELPKLPSNRQDSSHPKS